MRRHRPVIIFISLILVVVVLALTSVYFYKKYNRLSAGSPQASDQEVRSLVEKVGKLAVLPEDETPTVATVTDPEKLKDQDFFADAKVGDKVLIYSAAKKAILFDPKANKVVNIAPVNLGTSVAGASTGPTTTP